MPNGGVPRYMILHPNDGSPYVFYLERGLLKLFERSAWERDQAKAPALIQLDVAEGASIAWFLRYWLGEGALRPGYQMPGVKASFDY